MSISPEQINQAIKAIEVQLDILRRAAGVNSTETEVGVVGTFDGEFMVQSDGKRYQIPPNYASKSMLVPGDTIRMIEDPNGGPAKFKQIGKAERQKSTGILARKDGKFEVLTEEGSFKVLAAAIKHYEGEVGDSVTIQFPKNHVKGSWAAVEKVSKANAQTGTGQASAPTPAAPTPVVDAGQIVHAAPTPPPASAPEPTPVAATEPTPAPAPQPAQPTEVASAPETPQPVQDRPAKPAVSDRPRPAATMDRKPSVRSEARPAASRNNDRPKSTDRPNDRRTSDRPAPRPRVEEPAPQPKPAPAPQAIMPGGAGEISVSAVMDEDDLM